MPNMNTHLKKLKLLAVEDTLKTQDYLIPYSKDSFSKDEW
jgi:hypothetical protein